jgi:hypothetical protein
MVDRRVLWKYEPNPFGLVAFPDNWRICPDQTIFEQQGLSEYFDAVTGWGTSIGTSLLCPD